MSVLGVAEVPIMEKRSNAVPINILLIGGTGAVGRQLQPVLLRRGHNVTIASRNADPKRGVIGQDNLDAVISKADVVVLLSVINNHIYASTDDTWKVNVELPLTLAARCRQGSCRSLILFGSDLANSNSSDSVYSRSKAELLAALHKQADAQVAFFVLSPVYGEKFVDRLAFVDRLPGKLKAILITAIGAVRPLTHIERIADAIEKRHYLPSSSMVFEYVVDDQNYNPLYRVFTRICDLSFAVAILTVFGWLIAILAIAVTITSPGPALFRQERVGRNGKIFKCLKFRTMHLDTPQRPTHEMSASAVTGIGRYLRASKLDELPQIFNIIANQMSLVGPRPCLLAQHSLILERQRLGVLNVKPGVTGWSQVRGIDMSDPRKLAQSDAEYCARRSVTFYLRIILMTFLGKGQGDYVR